MTMQSSGPISLSDIQTEHTGSGPISISEYYGADDYIGVPTEGAISIADFYDSVDTVNSDIEWNPYINSGAQLSYVCTDGDTDTSRDTVSLQTGQGVVFKAGRNFITSATMNINVNEDHPASSDVYQLQCSLSPTGPWTEVYRIGVTSNYSTGGNSSWSIQWDVNGQCTSITRDSVTGSAQAYEVSSDLASSAGKPWYKWVLTDVTPWAGATNKSTALMNTVSPTTFLQPRIRD